MGVYLLIPLFFLGAGVVTSGIVASVEHFSDLHFYGDVEWNRRFYGLIARGCFVLAGVSAVVIAGWFVIQLI